MVIRLTLNNRTGTIYLFREYEPDHLVGKSHTRQRNLLVGPIVYGRGKAVGPTDNKNKPPGNVALFLKPSRKLKRTKLYPVLIEKYHRIRRLQKLQYHFPFPLLLLTLRKVFGVLKFRKGRYVKGHVVTYTLGIVGNTGYKMSIDSLTHQQQFGLHEIYINN